MQEHPYHPCEHSLKSDIRQVNYCFISAYCCHSAKILVFIIYRLLTQMYSFQVFCKILCLVNCNICQLRMPFRIFGSSHKCHIAYYKYVVAPDYFIHSVHFNSITCCKPGFRNSFHCIGFYTCCPDQIFCFYEAIMEEKLEEIKQNVTVQAIAMSGDGKQIKRFIKELDGQPPEMMQIIKET